MKGKGFRVADDYFTAEEDEIFDEKLKDFDLTAKE